MTIHMELTMDFAEAKRWMHQEPPTYQLRLAPQIYYGAVRPQLGSDTEL